MIRNITFLFMTFLLLIGCQNTPKAGYKFFSDFPAGADPVLVGNRLTKHFIESPNSNFGKTKYTTPPKNITYPDVCTWLAALWFAESTKNDTLLKQLVDRFTPLMGDSSQLVPPANHVDVSVFGALPLEIYKITKDEKCKELGLYFADNQWTLPKDWTLEGQPQRSSEYYGMLSDANIFQKEQKEYADKGYSWQTRMWLDDMFMITTLQAQAYRIVGDPKYVDRSAYEMEAYMDSIQLPNGLFDHAPGVPYKWGRANGWMALGFTELLRILPQDNKYRPSIMAGYEKMMNSLLQYQCEDGMWRQLIDRKELWKETSGTAMFTYAFITGVQMGWLDENIFGPAARKAWIALTSYIDENNDVTDVCEGTNIENNLQYYIDRKRITGDLHGQAPVLWCAYALTRK